MKLVKRGIKMLQRCDSLTGYIYDINVYARKEEEEKDRTLGEKVVNKFAEIITTRTKVTLFLIIPLHL